MDKAMRELQLSEWFSVWSKMSDPVLHGLAGDAGFRRYFRVEGSAQPLILCDAPPATEKNREFFAIASAFAAWGVRVPAVLAADLERGYFVLEDLGDTTLLPCLSEATADAYYARASKMLCVLATADSAGLSLLNYSSEKLREEMALFPEWFCTALLHTEASDEAVDRFDALSECLAARAVAQTQVVVHRDFHARNLMVLTDGHLATIDFQDAVIGPVSYDPVSLLRDCYLSWPEPQVQGWARVHYRRLRDTGVVLPTEEAFLIDFDYMGLQRHIKVLGIFARLFLRDGKSGYLKDLPRVVDYVRRVLERYGDEPALANFARWFDESLMPLVRAQAWYRAS